jgi:hypothetical protein
LHRGLLPEPLAQHLQVNLLWLLLRLMLLRQRYVRLLPLLLLLLLPLLLLPLQLVIVDVHCTTPSTSSKHSKGGGSHRYQKTLTVVAAIPCMAECFPHGSCCCAAGGVVMLLPSCVVIWMPQY